MSNASFPLPDLVMLSTMVGTPQLYNTGTNVGGWLMVFNETPYQVDVEVGSSRKLRLMAQEVNILELFPGDNFATVTAQRYLAVQNPPSITIKFHYFSSKPEGTFPQALARQIVTADPSGTIGFSSFAIITEFTPAYNTSACGMNIFNPANSGVVCRIFSAVVIPFGLSIVTANAAIRTDGVDNGASSGFFTATIFSRNIGVAVAKAHVTYFQDQTIAAPPNHFVGIANLYETEYDFITSFGGVVNAAQLYPGQNFLINVQNPEVGSITSFILGWSEQ